jgi:hypothetical protein
MKRMCTLAGGLIALAGMAATAVIVADEQPDAAGKRQESKSDSGRDDLPLKDYMRKKLAASNQILEGLCTEDSALVLEGARALKEMSTSERWRVHNDTMYRQFSGEFREITQQLVEAAQANNKDRAALKWMDATMSCIDCHRYVRGIRLASADAK